MIKISKLKEKWYACPHDDYRTKNEKNLINHLANKHDIGVKWDKWYECPHCYYKTKQKDTLKEHIDRKHISKLEIN